MKVKIWRKIYDSTQYLVVLISNVLFREIISADIDEALVNLMMELANYTFHYFLSVMPGQWMAFLFRGKDQCSLC